MKVARLLALFPLLIGANACTRDTRSDLEQELDQVQAKVMHHEGLIADCMRDKGWEYIPFLPPDVMLEREKVLAEANGREFDARRIDLPDDPNDAIVARLSEAERDARSDAYWGDLQKGGSDQGCYQSTYEQAWGNFPIEPGPETIDKLAEVDAAVAADERVIAALGKFVGCMAERGYQVSSLHDVFRQYGTRIDKLEQELRDRREDPEESAAMNALRAEEDAAYQAYSECEGNYIAVENEVRTEVLKEKGL